MNEVSTAEVGTIIVWVHAQIRSVSSSHIQALPVCHVYYRLAFSGANDTLMTSADRCTYHQIHCTPAKL